MNNNQRQSNRGHSSYRQGSYTSNFTLVCLAVIAVLAFINFKIYSGIITDNPETLQQSVSQTKNAAQLEKEAALKAIQAEINNNFTKVTVTLDDTKYGNLVLVNNTHPFSFDASPSLVHKEEPEIFYAHQSNDYYVSYPSRDKLKPTAIRAFNDLTAGFAAQTGINNLLVIDSLRTLEDQQRIYEEKGAQIATIPGCSEHHTGLAFDLDTYGGGTFDGTGDYAWVAQNCHKYGYILRYAEDKTDITGISYEPWHFRYVGKEHATYMAKNNLCLEEYIMLLANYPIDSARLHITTDDGENYVVYSQSVSGTSAEIYVPKNNEYTVSGDNSGHVIVSYKIENITAESTQASSLPESTDETENATPQDQN